MASTSNAKNRKTAKEGSTKDVPSTTVGTLDDDQVIVVVGLDNAGKTTLATALEKDIYIEGLPITISPEAHQIQSPRVPLKAYVYDMGGQTTFREGWEIYFPKAAALVFVVDAACPERFDEACVELQKIIDAEWIIALGLPILVLGNKTDLKGSVKERELVKALKLSKKVTGKTTEKSTIVRPLEVFMCSLKENRGYVEAFDWLNEQVSPKARACSSCTIL